MIESRWFNRIVAVVMALAVCLTGFLCWLSPKAGTMASASAKGLTYPDKIFDPSSIMSVEISVDDASWQQMLENATAEEYICCNVTVNGTTFQDVGIRPKGNTSLTQVASDDTTDRYSFKLEFDHYIKGQTCFGLDKLCLNNVQADTTYLKEYLSYDMTTFLGVTSPLYAFSSITVNGEAWGFYLAVEAVEDSFVQRNYGTDDLALYKPESSQAAGVKGMPSAGFSSSGGSDLVYTNDDISSYGDIFNASVFDVTEKEEEKVIQALKIFNESSDPEEIERYLDVDQVLRYFACNTFLVNLDSYVSNLKHNYYLKEEDGVLSIIPWDFNLAFGGFQSGSASSAVNFPINTPVASGTELSERPLIGALLSIDSYKTQYHAYLQQLVDGYFNNGYFTQKISQMKDLISSYVEADASAFYTYDQFETGIAALKEFGLLRAQSVEGQLKGTIPSTSEGQSEDSSALIDASSLTLSDMGQQGGGGMGGGGMGGGFGGNGQRPDGNFPGGQNGNGFTMPGSENNSSSDSSSSSTESNDANGQQPPAMGDSQGGNGQMTPPNGTTSSGTTGQTTPPNGFNGDANGQMTPPDGAPTMNGNQSSSANLSTTSIGAASSVPNSDAQASQTFLLVNSQATPPDGFNGDANGQMTPPNGFNGDANGQTTPPDGFNGDTNGQMTPPNGFNGDANGQMAPPDGFNGDANGQMTPPDGFNGDVNGQMTPPNGFNGDVNGGMMMPNSGNQTVVNPLMVWLFAGGVILLFGAILWVWRFRRRKYWIK